MKFLYLSTDNLDKSKRAVLHDSLLRVRARIKVIVFMCLSDLNLVVIVGAKF